MRLLNHYVIILPGSRGYEKVDYKSASAVYECVVASYIYQPRGEIILIILDLGQSSGTVGTDPRQLQETPDRRSSARAVVW
jgi:hypothetical protein